MVKHKRIARLSRIAVILVLVVALCLACVSPGYAVIAEASIIVPAVIAALAAFGIGTSVSAMQSGDIISWYTQKLEQWALTVGQTVSTLLDVAKLTTDPLGMLRLAPSFLLNVKAFAQWLQTDMGVVAGGNAVVTPYGGLSECKAPYIGSSVTKDSIRNSGLRITSRSSLWMGVVSMNSSQPIYVLCYKSGSTGQMRIYSTVRYAPCKYVIDASNTVYDSSASQTTTISGVTIYRIDPSYSTMDVNQSLVPVYNSANEADAAFASWIANPSGITLTPDTVIDYPDTTGDDDEDMPYVIDYGGEAGDTVQDAADTVMQKVISNDLVIDGAIETPAEEMEWSDIMSPRAVNGLDDIFPFCIPFDVYHFFQAMIATPTAPHFEVPFVVPGLVNYTFVLDFAQFNTVAQIFRTMELLCFCIGLALATRRLIRG